MTFLLQILLTSVVFAIQFLLVGAGLYLINAVSRAINVALASSLTVGAYSFYFFNLHYGFFVGMMATLIFSVLFGIVNYLLLRKFVLSGKHWLAFLVSIALYLLVQALAGLLFGSDGKFLVPGVLTTFNFGPFILTQVDVIMLVYGFVVAIAAFFFFYFLPFGRIVRAIAQHPRLITLFGIHEEKVRFYCYLFPAVIIGILGVPMAMDSALTPIMGQVTLITAFMALLVGGINDFKGLVVATFILTLVPEVLVSGGIGFGHISEGWKFFVQFIVAVLILFVRPQGIFYKSNRLT